MANADYTSRPSAIERPAPSGFIPLETPSQHSAYPHDATLYLNTHAPADALYDAAEHRLNAVIALLSTLERIDQDNLPTHNVCQISRSLRLLASDAQSLYQADHQRRRGR